jgi:hypothetical protein
VAAALAGGIDDRENGLDQSICGDSESRQSHGAKQSLDSRSAIPLKHHPRRATCNNSPNESNNESCFH